MAIMKWGKPPGGDANDRKAHVMGHGENVKLVHAAFGDHIEGSAQINTLGPNIELAATRSTAPYTGPPIEDIDPNTEPPNIWGYRSSKREKRCMANGDTCKAWAVDKYDKMYCNAHGRLSEGRPAWPSNEKTGDDGGRPDDS